MRVITLIVLSIAVSGGGAALAQSEPAPGESTAEPTADSSRPETPEEFVVRGKRLADFRDDLRKARERAYDIFNEINSNDDFDVHCSDESRAGTRVPLQVCRARFESRISASAVREYMATLTGLCPANGVGFIDYQACMFSGYGKEAASRARGIEAEGASQHDLMNDEINRLAQQDPRFGQAIIDFFEANRRFDEARGQARQPAPQVSVTEEQQHACLPRSSRVAQACEPTTTVVRTEQEFAFSLEFAAPKISRCAAMSEIRYTQRGSMVSVEGTIENRDCAASNGEHKLAVSVRDEHLELKTLDFLESWQRQDDQPVKFGGDYPIGENVDVVRVRSIQLRCTCTDAPADSLITPAEPPITP
jgi:hypothetical protein